jgi:Protein of unknown function (DUF3175)
MATRRLGSAGGRLRASASERTGATAARRRGTRWSRHVTETSNALDLEADVFTLRSAAAVAVSLKRSALRSKRRKASAYQSAMSMLNFYINRAGKGLSASQKRVLERAKGQLRREFGRAPQPRTRRPRR